MRRRGVTLQEWRENSEDVDYARRLFSDPQFQRMLGVVHAHTPYQTAADSTAASIALGRVNGYRECLGIFELLPVAADLIHPEPESEFPEEHPSE